MAECPHSPTLSSLPLAFPALSLHSPPPSISAEAPRSVSSQLDLDTPTFSDTDADADPLTTVRTRERTPAAFPAIFHLPQELLEQIGLAVCRLEPVGPPKGLISLLLTCRRFNELLGPRNDGFYADLFRERFDWESVSRRWQTMKLIEERREKKALLASVTEVRPDDSVKFETGASFTPPHDLVHTNTSPWRTLTSKDLAREFRRRCVVLTKMRKAVQAGHIPPTSSRPPSPRLQAQQLAMSPDGREHQLHLPEPDDLTQNLWTCYLMLLENDERNKLHLLEYAHLKTYMKLFYEHALFSEAMKPGWPRQTAGRALGLWIGWLGGDDIASETSKESDERFFVLKPYVFAAHKFDAFQAPWPIPSFPISHKQYPVLPPPRGPFMADLRPRSNAQLVTHMGRKIPLAPPVLSHAAIFSFFYRVEQDPTTDDEGNPLLGIAGGGHNARPPPQLNIGAPHAQHAPGAAHPSTPTPLGVLTAASKPVRTNLPTLESTIHDRDFTRLSSCIDPYSSLGLPTLRTRGDLSGSWEGRFSFFDFDSYRDMLGGRMRSLYEGPFGDQPQVWKIEERIVRLKKGEKPGGKGSVLNAGFEPGQGVPEATASGSLVRATSRGAGGSSSPPSSSGVVDPDERPTAKRPRSVSGLDYPALWDDGPELDEDGEYEILLSGSGHSAWGQFLLKGRVRSYDGMFSIVKEYTPDSRGRWIYRGYVIGGNLVGRWRDSHTPVDMSGYEGTFLMTRRGA